jgi:hypothetical protein
MLCTLRAYIQYRRLINAAKTFERSFESSPSEIYRSFAAYKQTLDSAIRLAQYILQSPPKKLMPWTARGRIKPAKQITFTPQTASAAYATLIREAQIAGCELFPISGTLLGFVRENDFLKHDYDLDLGVMNDACPDSFTTLVRNLSRNPDIKFVRAVTATNALAALNPELRAASRIPLKTKVVFSSGVVADIMNHVPHESSFYHGSKKNLWRNSSFTLLRGHPKGRGASFPDNCEAYLAENYGDWRVPKVDYVYFLDTPNWEPVVSAVSLDYYVKTGIGYASNKPSRCLRVCNETLPRFLDRLNLAENNISTAA